MEEQFLQRISLFWGVALVVLLALASGVQGASQTCDRLIAPAWEQESSCNWYEGAFLGNGDVGVVVFATKDQLTYAIGKNDFWDRRRYFDSYKPLSFHQYMAIAKNETQLDPETHSVRMPESVLATDHPIPAGDWPLPKPVGQITLSLPKQGGTSEQIKLEPLRHVLSLEHAELNTNSSALTAVSRVQKDKNLIVIHLTCPHQGAIVRMHRDPDDPSSGIPLPQYSTEGMVGFLVQDMPAEKTYPDGFQCAVAASVVDGSEPVLSTDGVSWSIDRNARVVLAVVTTRDDSQPLDRAKALLTNALTQGDNVLKANHRRMWGEFWDRSWIKVDDTDIERWWYLNNYFLACAARPGAVAPGLYGPWIVENHSAWHGGYTIDYNFQQTFSAALSCNHVELLEPYLETLERMLPAAQLFASEVFGCDGIAFPHQSYPINMLRQWHAYQTYVCETPWAVQHFWERYQYTLDEVFLRDRAYRMIAGCADFLADYAIPEADGKYAFEPTRSPEHHHLLPGLPFNRNGTPELALARYVFKAAIEAAHILGEDSPRVAKWRKVLDGLPDYPRLRNQLGDVFLDCEATPPECHFVPPAPLIPNMRPSKVPGNHGPWMTYNCPTSMLQVWPAGQIDMDSPPEQLLTAMRTWHTLKCEGSNDLIMRHMMAARLGIPTLRQFKSEIAPRLMPNGSITLLLKDIAEGNDTAKIYTSRYFMYEKNGVYTENFAYPLVINEMMLQSHNGVLKFFPTMDYDRKAEFHNLRARGGFGVSAAMDRGFTLWAEITPTVDGQCRVRLPWPAYAVSVRETFADVPIDFRIDGDDILFSTVKGKVYRLEPKLTLSKSVAIHSPSAEN